MGSNFRLMVYVPNLLSAVLIFLFSTGIAPAQDGKPIFPSFTDPIATDDLLGRVVSSRDLPVADATVYLVPIGMIDMTPITASAVFDEPYAADAYDEPLEDAIARHRDQLPSGKTDQQGHFRIFDIPDGRFFVYVAIADGDVEHLPGGDKSRASYDAQELRGHEKRIQLSSRPPPHAEYIGSTECLECHEEQAAWKQTGHKLAWSRPGNPGPHQDFSQFPDFFEALESWIEAESYDGGTRLEIGDYNPEARGNVKFKIRLADDDRVEIEKIYADIYFWKSAQDGEYYITVENRLNESDPASPAHLKIEMVYGGAVLRQRYMVSVPGSLGDRQGIYTLLQFHPNGDDRRLTHNRRVWRDYKFNYWWSKGEDGEYGTSDDRITAPAVNENTIQAMCAACHVTGYERYLDEETGQALVRGVNDPNGAFNIDDDPEMDEVNVGCETCHGPGSEHAAFAGLGENFPSHMVNPAYLSVERETAVCGRCHDRRQGPGGPTLGYTQPINEDGEMMPPGLSRHTMITEYSVTRGPIPGRHIWVDDIHSRNPHQQYADYMKSGMYRNDRRMVGCSDCHDMHGGTGFRRSLVGDPDDASSPLCQSCHAVDINAHMQHQLGSEMKGAAGTRCVDCHMPGTAIHGGDSGRFGRMVGAPPYYDALTEEINAYLQGDINSHVFDVPRTTTVGVQGELPGNAMPIPYTSACGTCHDVSEIQHK